MPAPASAARATTAVLSVWKRPSIATEIDSSPRMKRHCWPSSNAWDLQRTTAQEIVHTPESILLINTDCKSRVRRYEIVQVVDVAKDSGKVKVRRERERAGCLHCYRTIVRREARPPGARYAAETGRGGRQIFAPR